MKSKSTAGILALLFGGIGIHKFYLGKIGQGIIYLIFCWTFIPMIISIIEAIILLTMDDYKFHFKYNPFLNLHSDSNSTSTLNIENRKLNSQVTSTLKSPKGWDVFEYPELKDFEVAIQTAITKKKELSFNINLEDLDREKWEYLIFKYPNVIKAPITSEYNTSHNLYKGMFERLKPKIEEGYTICMNEHTEKNVRPFCEKYLPEIKFKTSRPIEIKTIMSGLSYHDYSKKQVRAILEYNSFADLDLVLEPDNQYDCYAVKLMLEDYFLGYVPQRFSTQVFKAISEEKNVTCNIDDYKNTGSIAERITIFIEIKHDFIS